MKLYANIHIPQYCLLHIIRDVRPTAVYWAVLLVNAPIIHMLTRMLMALTPHLVMPYLVMSHLVMSHQVMYNLSMPHRSMALLTMVSVQSS